MLTLIRGCCVVPMILSVKCRVVTEDLQGEFWSSMKLPELCTGPSVSLFFFFLFLLI